MMPERRRNCRNDYINYISDHIISYHIISFTISYHKLCFIYCIVGCPPVPERLRHLELYLQLSLRCGLRPLFLVFLLPL